MRRRYALLLAAVVALALITWLRIHLINTLADQGYFAKYLVFADRILAGQIPRDRLTDVSPAYLWMVVLLRAIGFGVGAIRTVQIVALSVAAALCAIAANRIAGVWAAIAAALMILANRAALVTATELEPETLILLVIAAALALLATWEQTRRLKVVAAAGLFVGIAIAGRPVAAATLILITVWLLWRDRRAAIAFAGAALAPIAIVLFVNGTLAGQFSIMEPGTGLYDGNNPLATGCAGVLPLIVADLDQASSEPDFLHVAYRLVAARATGTRPDTRVSNRYWSGKAMAWMRAYPRAAARLLAWKALLSVHNYDIYDLATTKRKADELSVWPAIPFGLLTTLALIALALRRDRRALVAAALFVVASVAALVAFNVSARQRDALLPPLTILAAVGVAEIARRRSRPLIIALGAAVAGMLLLGVDIPPQSEDAYSWWASFTSAHDLDVARVSQSAGATNDALHLAAIASVLRTSEPPVVPTESLRAAALEAVRRKMAKPVLFDAALALQKADAWLESDAVLAALGDYKPRRENRVVSSVAYYRARAAMHTGHDPRPFLASAAREAPGDPNVLAALSVQGDIDATTLLNRLHDPYTRDYALALARLDAGDRAGALVLRDHAIAGMPEWARPRTIR
jgi:4-amino-4-deoxy-L-arabinose transferase-like glycosyltransferase